MKNIFIETVRTSSGVRFAPKPKQTFGKKVPFIREQFAKNCSHYGLTPDFYMALCVESVDSEECFYLQELDGAHGVLLGDNGISMMMSFEKVLDMLYYGLEQEQENLEEKIKLFVLDRTIPEDNMTIKAIREDIKNKKKIIQNAAYVRNFDMKEVYDSMHVAPNAGCKIGSFTYEFVSYRPGEEKPYVLECLDTKSGSFRFVNFDGLKKALASYAEETEDIEEWLKMVENMKPMAAKSQPDFSDDFSQEFFVF